MTASEVMAMPEEKSRKPREMVHRAQAQCANWLHQLRRARQQQPDAPDIDRAHAEFHSAVMLYWEQIKRFRDRDHIEDEWHREAVVELDGEEQPLEALADRRLGTIATQQASRNPETNAVQQTATRRPWRLSPQQALAVYDQLDKCANSLGFDAEPVQQRSIVEPVEVDPDDETASKFDPQPVEVPADGD
jgi:hypothetical protein